MKKSSRRALLFFRRSIVVAALLVICEGLLVHATDRNRTPLNSASLGLNADSLRKMCAQNYVELPLDETAWIDGAGDWFNPSNWSAGLPNSSTIAQINNGGTAQITSEGAAASTVDLGVGDQDVGTLSTSGSGNLEDDGFLHVGISGTGTLNITNGGVVSSILFSIGINSGSNGTATVSGSGSTWANLAICSVAFDGVGMLNIMNGANVSGASSTIIDSTGSGTVTVDGADSIWTQDGNLTIGGSGVGTLTISNVVNWGRI
jgi:fibronectin-binding autotransporter adhesin